MNKKQEIKYFDKHWKKMKDGLQAFVKTDDKEQLHALRVEVKKLRAMLTLLETVTHNHHLRKLFRPVRKVFKHAGEIRNAQMNLQLAHDYQLHNMEFENSQRDTMNECAEDFKLKAPRYLKKLKRAHNRIKDSLENVKDKSVATFYKKQLKQIAGSLATPHFDDALHNCRKQMKVLMYNHKLTGKALEQRMVFNEPYIDSLQSDIGDWHDHVLALQLFDSPEVKSQPAVDKIKLQNSKSEQHITELCRDFFTKATAPEPEAAEDKSQPKA